jgi:hypothetical protein
VMKEYTWQSPDELINYATRWVWTNFN